jgi:hypothetical protein
MEDKNLLFTEITTEEAAAVNGACFFVAIGTAATVYGVQGVTREVKNSHSKEYMQQRMLKNCLKNDKKNEKIIILEKEKPQSGFSFSSVGRLICFSTKKLEEKIDN